MKGIGHLRDLASPDGPTPRRMVWIEDQRGWLANPDEVVGALVDDGFDEYRREVIHSRRGRPRGGVWQGLNASTGSVVSAIWVNQSERDHAIVYIDVDGELVGRPKEAGMESWWSDLDEAILGWLADEGPLAPAEIGCRLGLSEGAVASLVSLLAQEGKVRICLVAALWRNRTSSFWCSSWGQAVTCEFRERTTDDRRVAVNWCTAFAPPEAIECSKRCLDDDLERLDPKPVAAA